MEALKAAHGSELAVEDLSVRYGEREVLHGISLGWPTRPRQRDRRTVRVRQDDSSACAQPARRDDAARTRERPHRSRRRRPPRRRCDGDPPPCRHGLPASKPVPDDDLRQRRLRAPAAGFAAAAKTHARRRGRASACTRGAVGGGQERSAPLCAPTLRRAAAAPLHRPRSRRRARGDPVGRAVLVARSPGDSDDRGVDPGAALAADRRRRDAQPRAGPARVRPARVHPRRPAGRDAARQHASSRNHARRRRRRTSPARSVEPLDPTNAPGASRASRCSCSARRRTDSSRHSRRVPVSTSTQPTRRPSRLRRTTGPALRVSVSEAARRPCGQLDRRRRPHRESEPTPRNHRCADHNRSPRPRGQCRRNERGCRHRPAARTRSLRRPRRERALRERHDCAERGAFGGAGDGVRRSSPPCGARGSRCARHDCATGPFGFWRATGTTRQLGPAADAERPRPGGRAIVAEHIVAAGTTVVAIPPRGRATAFEIVLVGNAKGGELRVWAPPQ